jgi:DNA-binding winged helix-turn-helix (wHTH) protein
METVRSSKPDRVFRFGPFELSEREGELRKNGVRIKLQEQPFRVLVELVASAGKVVSREELQQRLWPADTFVDFDVGLNTAIRKLRQSLNDDAEEPRYIETLARRGYRFVAPATVISAATEPATEPVSGAEAPFASAINSPQAPESNKASEWGDVVVTVERSPEAPRTKDEAESYKKWTWAAIGAAALTLPFLFWWTRPPAAPVVESITQLTDNAQGKTNLQTDGARIYFNGEQSGLGIMQVSVKGGAVAAVPSTILPAAVAGIAPDGSALLVLQGALAVPRPVWELPLPAGEPRRMGNLDAHEASITPDGRLLLSRVADLFIAEKDGSNPRKIISLTEGHFGDAAMSPDGYRVVFTHYPETELYIANSDGSGMRLLAKNRDRGGFCCARWTPDGHYIVFATRFPVPRQDLWYMRMNDGWLQHASAPKRLTAGPLSYWSPVPSRDGRTVFATGTTTRRELVRYDLTSHTFVPLFPGLSATDITFSADGQWMAYVSLADHCLWRSRSDGSDRLQLTFPPVFVYSPFISPDGKWVAYGSSEGNDSYMLSMDGGTPQKLINAPGYGANWSPDGNFLVFNEATNAWQTPEVKLVDLRTGQISHVPGGQMVPLWAAPGKFIAARRDLKSLQIYDLSSQRWSDFTKPEDGPVGNWAHSPDFKYFYYTTRGQDPRVFRVRMADMKPEVVASLKNLDASLGGVGYTQLSVAPDGSPVLAYEVGKQEIYALTVKWP